MWLKSAAFGIWLGVISTAIAAEKVTETDYSTPAWTDCRQNSDVDRRLAGCTLLLAQKPGLSSTDRASVLERRGMANVEKLRLSEAQNDFSGALSSYTAAIKAGGDDSVLQARGNLYVNHGEFAKAADDFDRALVVARARHAENYILKDIKFYLAVAQTLAGNMTTCKEEGSRVYIQIAACTDLQDKVKLNASASAAILAWRGSARAISGDIDGGIRDLAKSIELEPGNADYLTRLGDIQAEAGNFAKAASVYSQSLNLQSGTEQTDPNKSLQRMLTLRWRGIMYFYLGSEDLAIQDFKQNKADNYADLLLGFVYLHQGRIDDALEEFAKFPSATPSATKNLLPDDMHDGLIERARLYAQKGQYGLALAELNKIVPAIESRDFLDLRAAIYEKMGMSDQVQADRQRAALLPLKSSDTILIIHKIRTLLLRGEVREANEYFNNNFDPSAALVYSGDALTRSLKWYGDFARAILLKREEGASSPPQVSTDPKVRFQISPELADAFSGPQVTINGSIFHAELDSTHRTVSLLGPPDSVHSGLNFVESGLRSLQLWREDWKLENFDRPYKSSYAIVVAIDKYNRPNDPAGPTPYVALPNMVAGATDLVSTLVDVGFPRENITTLFNEDATSGKFEHAMEDFWQGAAHDNAGRLLIYFGGHGDSDDHGNGFLVTYNFDAKRPTLTSFRMADFVGRQFSNISAHHVLVLLDSCDAGMAIPGMHTMDEKTDADWMKRFATRVELSQDLKEQARALLVAGTGKDQAVDDGGGIFTQAVIDGLKGGADYMKENVIEFGELSSYVKHKVRVRAAAMGKEQVPSAFTGDAFGRGTFLFPLPAKAIVPK